MEQLNYFPLAIPSNIYGFAHLKGDKSRLLISTLEKQIFCIEYHENRFTCTEVHFAYIPNGADIISIDAFERTTSLDIVVGITFFKNSKDTDSSEQRKTTNQVTSRAMSGQERYYFNIYSSFVGMNRFDLNQIAQDCQTFELDFVPFHLYHTSLQTADGTHENIWLLSGSDCCIHIYREDVKKQCFYKEKMDLFPELSNFKSVALWIDVMNLENQKTQPKEQLQRRLSAVGCEDGLVGLFVVEYANVGDRPEIVRSHRFQFDAPILSVRLFRDHSCSHEDRLFRELLNMSPGNSDDIHLLVGNSCEPPVVFRNVFREGLLIKRTLPSPSQKDLLLATAVGDVDFDGQNEILLGKYSKELNIYRYDVHTDNYVLKEKMRFSHPLQVIAYVDLTGNGLKELVTISTKGVAILRHRFSAVVNVLQEKVRDCLVRLNQD